MAGEVEDGAAALRELAPAFIASNAFMLIALD